MIMKSEANFAQHCNHDRDCHHYCQTCKCNCFYKMCHCHKPPLADNAPTF